MRQMRSRCHVAQFEKGSSEQRNPKALPGHVQTNG